MSKRITLAIGAIAGVSLILFGMLVWACTTTVLKSLTELKGATPGPQVVEMRSGEPQAIDVNVKVAQPEGGDLGHGGPLEMVPYPSAIGSVGSASTLTTSYNGVSTTVMNTAGLPNIAFNVGYTPRSYGSLLFLQIERAFDVSCTNFYQYDTLTVQNDAILVNTQGTSTSLGTPFVIDWERTYASGTRRTASWDMTIAATCIRVSAKETTTSTAGTLNLEAYFTSN